MDGDEGIRAPIDPDRVPEGHPEAVPAHDHFVTVFEGDSVPEAEGVGSVEVDVGVPGSAMLLRLSSPAIGMIGENLIE